MLEFYKTFEDGTRKIQEPEPGCWINAIAPTEERYEERLENERIEQHDELKTKIRDRAGRYSIRTG